MKVSIQDALVLSLLSGLVKADRLYDAQERTVCAGVDFSECSVGELNWFAEQVQQTYNNIHMPHLYLIDTVWLGVGANQESEEGHGRRLQTGGGTGGASGCDYCRTDDDDLLNEGVSAALLSDHVAWGKDLTSALANSGFPCFEKTKNCAISLTTKSKKQLKDIKKEDNSFKAALRLQCQNVDWATLTSAEQRFVSSKLEHSYNDVQGGKKTLHNISWESSADQSNSWFNAMMGMSVEGRLGYFVGDLITGSFEEKNLRASGESEMIGNWEAKLEQLLGQGPFSALTHANGCHIQMDISPSMKQA